MPNVRKGVNSWGEIQSCLPHNYECNITQYDLLRMPLVGVTEFLPIQFWHFVKGNVLLISHYPALMSRLKTFTSLEVTS